MIRSILFDLAEVYVAGMIGAEHEIAAATGRSPKDVFKQLNVAEVYDLFRGEIPEATYWVIL